MNSSFDQLPLSLSEQIDAVCSAFEHEWKTDNKPLLADFLSRFNEQGRPHALRELLIIEISYRRSTNGQPITDEELILEHGDRIPELVEYLRIARRTLDSSDAGNTELSDAKSEGSKSPVGDSMPTIHSHTPSRGLHIRCPHCSNAVELLADTAFENVTCSVCGSAFSLVDREEETRQASSLKTIGRFELISRLGIGGFGTVWKARDTELDRSVAIKIPRKGQLDENEIEQFYREARSAAQLRHPNIVPVHEVGREKDTIFIVSELVRGVSLSDWMTDGVCNTRQTAEMMATIADALHHAHQQGVIHRDLKPSNILIDDDGRLHLMDFGLAKREFGEISMTMDGQILGTPAYMSPEQASGKNHWIDCRTDIYSLGATLFRMLTGELPYRGNAQMQIHHRLSEDAPDPRKLNRHISRDMATICLKCLEREPNGRYATAHELAEELRRFLRGEPINARPVSRVERIIRWGKRKPALAIATALMLVLAVGGPIVAFWIEHLRQRQGELLEEKAHVIARQVDEKQLDASKISQLSKQLAVWEGRANPWKEYWPPNAENKPRTALLEKLFTQSTQLDKSLSDGVLDREQQAYAHLSLAIMNDELMQAPTALTHYHTAHDLLRELADEQPDEIRYRLAQADCLSQLARLSAEDRNYAGQAVKSQQLLARLAELLRQLANQKNTRGLQLQQLDTELKSAMTVGFESDSDHLARVVEIEQNIVANFPSDPTELYKFTCQLARCEPVLAATTTVPK
jgi:serine/threonine protein kinase/ribosomal protein S27E